MINLQASPLAVTPMTAKPFLSFICSRLISSLIILSGLCNSALAQPQNPVKIPQVIPPSPDAASLGKYGSTPVGLNTGIPNINLPIYTVKSGSLTLPISLSYHAGGIKVSEVASMVGLGWSLNAGGVISRSVVGKCDEGGFWSNAIKSFDSIDWVNDFGYLHAYADQAEDGESDYYFYNFNGHSGKFVYQQNEGSVDPFIIPESPIKIEFTENGYEVTDETGVLYKFGVAESMISSTETYASAYYLSEIVSADGADHIYLSYSGSNSYTEGNSSYTETIGQQCDGPGEPENGYHTWTSNVPTRAITTPRLNEIVFANGKVKFIFDDTRSDLPSHRLQEVQIFSKKPDTTYLHRKSFTLGEDYFVSPTGTGKNKYRLKLTDLKEKDAQGTTAGQYHFYYNESVMLPERLSTAQDWWGFYNGKTLNTSLIASDTITVVNADYFVGGGNRNPNGTAMQACVLNKIVYPTGGFTEFDYETHLYANGAVSTPHSASASSGALGDTTNLLQQTATFTPTRSGYANVITHCSNVDDADPYFSRVIVREQGGAALLTHYYDPATYSPFNAELDKSFTVYLTGGVTYELVASSKGTSTSPQLSGAAFSQASIHWHQVAAQPSTMAGGLRIKEMRDYAHTGATPQSKLYKYGVGENGNGVLFTTPEGLNNSVQEIDFIFTQLQTGMCNQTCAGLKKLITGNPAYDLTSLNGASTRYEEVTVYEDSVNAPNGKQVYKFTVEVDQFTNASKAYNNGRFQHNNSWQAGDEIVNTVYRGNTTEKVNGVYNQHSILRSSEITGTKVGWAVSFEGCGAPAFAGNQTCCNNIYFYVFDYPIFSGVKKLISTREVNYSSADPAKSIITQSDFYFDNLGPQHQQLSRKITLDSRGDTLESQYWYPADYGAIDNLPSLLEKNIIASPIKEEYRKNGNLVSGSVNRPDQFGKPIELHQYESATLVSAPPHNTTVLVPSGYVKKAEISYDATTKNIQSVQQTDNTLKSYVWGYNNTLPIAEVTNAVVTKVFHTSFEENGIANTESRTGSRVWSGVYTFDLPAANGTYKLTYWKKNGSNPWILVEEVATVSSGTAQPISIGTTGHIIDEVRLIPPDAQMTTYTYDAIIGITSMTDVNQNTTYYKYDDFGRLHFVKDNYGNVLKTYQYNFKQ